MANFSGHGILVVDGDDAVCDSIGATLRAAGYDVALAGDGAEALSHLRDAHLRDATPAVIIADLDTPQIAGFGFLTLVRRRFPQIGIAAMSEECHGDAAPSGMNADVFFSKGPNSGNDLLRIVADLLHRKNSVHAWAPGDGIHACGISYVMLTCQECMRAFPLSVEAEDQEQYEEIPCLFCSRPVRCAHPSTFPETKVTSMTARLPMKTVANA